MQALCSPSPLYKAPTEHKVNTLLAHRGRHLSNHIRGLWPPGALGVRPLAWKHPLEPPHTHSQHVLCNCGYPSQGTFSPAPGMLQASAPNPTLAPGLPSPELSSCIGHPLIYPVGKKQAESGLHFLSINLHHDARSR